MRGGVAVTERARATGYREAGGEFRVVLCSAKYLMPSVVRCILPSSTVRSIAVTALTRLLFPAPAEVRNTASIFRWWESRRLTFNVIVGGTGLVTLAAMKCIALLPPLSMDMPVFWPGVLLYGFFANLFYSFGFVTEATMQRAWREETPRVGPALFRQGLIFSVGLTLFPIALMSIGWAFQLLRWVLR